MTRFQTIFLHIFVSLLVFAGFAGPAQALDDIDFDLRTTLSAIQAERGIFQGDDVESSGTGIGASGSVTFSENATRVKIAIDPTVFNFSDPDRETRKSLGLSVEASQQVGKNIRLAIRSRRVSNLVTLESRSVNQRALRGEVLWQNRNDRVRLRSEYLWRDYDDTARSEGKGLSVEIHYNRRIGPYHWARMTVRHDAIKSDRERLSYGRELIRAEYSLPIAKRLRLRPSLEYRQWQYDARVAVRDGGVALRRDTVINPEIGLSYGRTRGLYAQARAEYEFRSSNDVRFSEDAPRFSLDVGYRF